MKDRLLNKETINLRLKYPVNLVIWVSFDGTVGENKVNPPNTVFMRVDHHNQYWVPLDSAVTHVGYLYPILNKLSKFGFKSDINNLDEILNIVKDLEITERNNW